MIKDKVAIIIDMGSAGTQTIARRVRELGVQSIVIHHTAGLEAIMDKDPGAIIISGSPSYVNDDGSPTLNTQVYSLGIPVLGICYGMQITAYLLGGSVTPGDKREIGPTYVNSAGDEVLFDGIARTALFSMSHRDYVTALPDRFISIASTADCPHAAMKNDQRQIYGVQFHPETDGFPDGTRLIQNFLFKICGFTAGWTMEAYADEVAKNIKKAVKPNERVLLALSGGVDSAVCAALIQRVIGQRLICVFVNHGFMRKHEPEQIADVFTNHFPVTLIKADAAELFFNDLVSIEDPEQKRIIIGRNFIKVFKNEAEKLGRIEHFAQGTIYPDVIESGTDKGGMLVKSHHNVGGLPLELGFNSLIEPLRRLFKNEVRSLGALLGLPDDLVKRQPFPGPGLAIRVIGEVTPEKIEIVRECDWVLRDEFTKSGLSDSVNQYFTVLTGNRSVGIKNGLRTYEYTIAIRAIHSVDFMTATVAQIPYEVLLRISSRITSECAHVNRVVYDITSKPPAAIEWE